MQTVRAAMPSREACLSRYKTARITCSHFKKREEESGLKGLRKLKSLEVGGKGNIVDGGKVNTSEVGRIKVGR
jgi:hypothetical protein